MTEARRDYTSVLCITGAAVVLALSFMFVAWVQAARYIALSTQSMVCRYDAAVPAPCLSVHSTMESCLSKATPTETCKAMTVEP